MAIDKAQKSSNMFCLWTCEYTIFYEHICAKKGTKFSKHHFFSGYGSFMEGR